MTRLILIYYKRGDRSEGAAAGVDTMMEGAFWLGGLLVVYL